MKKELVVLVLLILSLACTQKEVYEPSPVDQPEVVPLEPKVAPEVTVTPEPVPEVSKEEMEKQEAESKPVEMDEPMPDKPTATAIGSFESRAHKGSGEALIIEKDGKTYLRFENFETDPGPDLRIYLSTGDDVSDAVDLGPIKGTKGNINYEVPEGTDLEKYDKVLVWCRAFSVLFTIAELARI